MKVTELFEALDSSYPYEFSDEENQVSAKFKTADGSEVVVRFQYWEKPEYWEIDFKRDGRVDMTGGGDAQKILSTFFKITKSFLKSYHPKFWGYSANAKEESRVSVYRRAFKRVLQGSQYVEASDRLDQIDHKVLPKWIVAKRARVGNGDQPLYVRKDMFL